ncbi:hypothetical protein AOLI_G00028110 [Acnodon oligacanthus]
MSLNGSYEDKLPPAESGCRRANPARCRLGPGAQWQKQLSSTWLFGCFCLTSQAVDVRLSMHVCSQSPVDFSSRSQNNDINTAVVSELTIRSPLHTVRAQIRS